MAKYVIIGKGAVGSGTAALLADRGEEVEVLSRSGGAGVVHTPGIVHQTVDATDAAALSRAAAGADAIFNCANPAYNRWATDWPPMFTAMLEAAERSGAVLVTMSNLYGYGPVKGPISENLPLAARGTKGRVRSDMWREALALHEEGRVRVTEARASDYVGPGVVDQGHLGERVVPRVLAGSRVSVLGDPDAAHSWTYVPDVAAAMVRLGTDERAWGRAWHVPTLAPRSARAMVEAIAQAADTAPVQVGRVPWTAVRAAGLVIPTIRELRETRYQFDEPFVIDSTAHTSTFGDEATPLGEQLRQTVQWWRDRTRLRAAA